MAAKNKFLIADLYCGGGGSSDGIIEACREYGIEPQLVAVNHWNIAIATNKLNHPNANTICASVQNVKPRELVPGGRLHVLWASPECTNHSQAKGGRPKDEQSRATAWDVLKWAQELYIDCIYIENVKEFMDWGPLDTKGHPIPSKKGKTFRSYIAALEGLGYKVDWQIMNAADYGAATSRRRLIIQAVRGKSKIAWPEPTHCSSPDNLFNLPPYVSAKTIIDWTIPGKSIFGRKKPLATKTLARIEAGIKKYWGPWAEPFLVMMRGQSKCRDVNQPVPTITTTAQGHIALVEPFFTKLRGTGTTADINDPAPTITAGGQHLGLVEPFMAVMKGSSNHQEIDRPLPTITTHEHLGIVEPFISRFNEGDNRNHSIGSPLPVVDCSNRYGVVEPLIIATGHTSAKDRSRSVNDPLSTVVTKAEHCLVEPLIMSQKFNNVPSPSSEPLGTITTVNSFAVAEPLIIHQMTPGRTRTVEEPLPTITTVSGHSLVEAFIVKFYGNEKEAHTLNNPLGTVTCKDRFALIEGDVYYLDIRFRMLKPHELAAAMSFPKNYQFTGTTADQVRQIGNAVPPYLSRALLRARLSHKYPQGKNQLNQELTLKGA